MGMSAIDGLNVYIPKESLKKVVEQTDTCTSLPTLPPEDIKNLEVFLAVSQIFNSSDFLMTGDTEEASSSSLEKAGDSDWMGARDNICTESGTTVACPVLSSSTVASIQSDRNNTESLQEAVYKVLDENSVIVNDRKNLEVFIAVSKIFNSSDFLMTGDTEGASSSSLEKAGDSDWMGARDGICTEGGVPLAVACPILSSSALAAIQAARNQTETLEEAVASVLIIAKKPGVCTPPAPARSPRVSDKWSRKPATVYPKDKVVITVHGENLDLTKVRHDIFEDVNFELSSNKKTLKISGKIPENAKIGTYEIELLDAADNSVLKTLSIPVSEFIVGGGTGTPTPTTGLEEFLYYTHKDQLNANVELKLGITGLDIDSNKSAALESRLPNDIDFKLSMNPKFKAPDWLEWDLGLNVPLKYNAHLEGDQTLLFQPSLDAKLQLTISKYFQPYAKGGIKYTFQQFNSPILFYENKNDGTVMAEGGFQTDIVDEFSISAYMGHEYTWFNRKFANVVDDRYTLNSREQIQYAGGRAKLTLEDVEAKLYADASLQGNGFESVTGVPYILPSVNAKDVVDMQRIRAGLEINISDEILFSAKYTNRMIFGGKKKSGGAAWAAENSLELSGKVKSDYGDFGLRYDWMEMNPMSHYVNHVIQFSYTPPIFKKAVSMGAFLAPGSNGSVNNGGFYTTVDFWKLLTNWAEPKKPVPEIDTTASSASETPTGANVINP